MSSENPPRAFSAPSRIDRRRAFKAELARVRGLVSCTDEEIGELVGVSATQWRRYLDTGSSDSLPAQDIPRLPEAMRRPLLEHVARQSDLRLVEGDQDDSSGAGERAHSIVGAIAAFLVEHNRATEDGHYDAAEADRLEPQVDVLLGTLWAIKSDLQLARERRVLRLVRDQRSTR